MFRLRKQNRGSRFILLLPVRCGALFPVSQLLQSVRRGALHFVRQALQRLPRGLLRELFGDVHGLQTAAVPHLPR